MGFERGEGSREKPRSDRRGRCSMAHTAQVEELLNQQISTAVSHSHGPYRQRSLNRALPRYS